MSLLKNLFILISSIILLCEGSAIDTVKKCSIKEDECLQNMLQTVLTNIGETGDKELGIPIIDPVELKDVTITLLGLLDLTMVDGTAAGVKNCVIKQFGLNFPDHKADIKLLCDLISIQGKYKISGTSSALKDVLGENTVHGAGNGKVVFEKIDLSLHYEFHLQKKDDGNIYLILDLDKSKYSHKLQGKASFAADNIYIGDVDSSELFVNYINENWKFVVNTFGKSFLDKSMEYVNNFVSAYFKGVALNRLLTDDLTSYL